MSARGNEADYRLPRTAVPRRYELSFVPDAGDDRFTGRAAIHLEVREAVTELHCHAVELDITGATLRPADPAVRAGGAGGDRPDAVSLEARLVPETERAVLVPAGGEPGSVRIPPGDYVLECAFSGAMNDQLRGIYRSTFEDPAGGTHSMVTTHFESHDARRAFPCWDEPDLKAVFSLSLEIDEQHLAVSNARVRSSEPAGDGRKRVEFHDTIPMSSYLVCFATGPLESTEPVEASGVPLAVVTPLGKKQLAGFALEAGQHALDWFAEYFALPYPGDKLDLVDVPDFGMGAMENLGCVTFREVYLLCDPETSSIPELTEIAQVIEHELAHMWFGDLVTMRWWNGIWLNEAFATYMSVCCLDAFRPEWKPWVAFGREKDVGLATDGLHTTRAIEYPVTTPDEAEAMFDALTYLKGGNVLRMVEQYLGTDRFRDGVRRYLAEHAYSNTETTDLWDAIESAAGGEPVRALMDSWVFQGGFPLVTAALEDDELVLTEQPFSYLSHREWAELNPDEASNIGRDWIVPVRVTERPDGVEPSFDGGPGEVRAALLGPGPHAAHPLRLPVGDGLPVVNAGGSGTYRLRYTGTLFDRIVANLGRLTALERFNLVSDTWATTLAGATSLGDFLALARKLAGEPDPNVWAIVSGALNLCDLAVAEADRPALQAFVRALVRPELDRIGFEAAGDEVPEVPRSRAIFVSLLGTIGADEEIRRHCRELFASSEASHHPLPANMAEAILSVVAFSGGEAEFRQMLEHVWHPLDPIDGDRHLFALANVRSVELGRELAELCLSEVKTQDGPYVLRALLANRVTGPTTWELVSTHYDELDELFSTARMPSVLGGVARLADVDEQGRPLLADEVRADLRRRDLGGHRRPVEQHLERLAVNLRFVREYRPILGELLRKA